MSKKTIFVLAALLMGSSTLGFCSENDITSLNQPEHNEHVSLSFEIPLYNADKTPEVTKEFLNEELGNQNTVKMDSADVWNKNLHITITMFPNIKTEKWSELSLKEQSATFRSLILASFPEGTPLTLDPSNPFFTTGWDFMARPSSEICEKITNLMNQSTQIIKEEPAFWVKTPGIGVHISLSIKPELVTPDLTEKMLAVFKKADLKFAAPRATLLYHQNTW